VTTTWCPSQSPPSTACARAVDWSSPCGYSWWLQPLPVGMPEINWTHPPAGWHREDRQIAGRRKAKSGTSLARMFSAAVADAQPRQRLLRTGTARSRVDALVEVMRPKTCHRQVTNILDKVPTSTWQRMIFEVAPSVGSNGKASRLRREGHAYQRRKLVMDSGRTERSLVGVCPWASVHSRSVGSSSGSRESRRHFRYWGF